MAEQQTRTVQDILHFLTPQQMAEEIVRLDAVIDGRAPKITMGRLPAASPLYQVRPNRCTCHPETCACNPWAIFRGETRCATAFSREHADQLAADLNRPLGVMVDAGARPLSEWHEDDGPVVWWKFPVDEPAWIGTPNSSDWPGYHTHWTPHPAVPGNAGVVGQEGANHG